MPPVTSTTRCCLIVSVSLVSCVKIDRVQARSTASATPMPPPMHSEARPLLGVAAAHLVQQRHQHAAARRADRVADRDGAAVDVDLAGVPAHLLVDRAGLRRERLVDLHQVEVLRLPAGLLQAQLRGRHRAHAHDRRVEPGARIGADHRERLQAERRRALRRHHQHRGGAVVQARGIAGGHRAGLVERRAQAGQRLGAGLAVDELVGGEHDRDRPSSARC